MNNEIYKLEDINSKKEDSEEIKSKIFTIRGMQVMLDRDLSELYKVTTKRLNEQVRRNKEKFPNNFMFQLTKEESEILRSQFATANISSKSRVMPYVFTEHGILQVASILNSNVAIAVSIKIIETFISMRQFLNANKNIFQRLGNLEIKQIAYESKQLDHDKKFETLFEALEKNELKPKQGIFFNGQVFDAYKFVSDIIRKAEKFITIIDNYIDDTVLNMLSKRKKGVKVIIFTERISEQLKLDLEKYNSQYPLVEIKKFKKSHDRFIIIDNSEVYHFGASLKDLGKKWFGFSKFEKNSLKILNKINEL